MPPRPALDRIVLLCGDTEFPQLRDVLAAHDRAIAIEHAETAAAVRALAGQDLASTRLIGFCTGVVVPGAIVRALGAGAYNLHPGSPDYPGWMPSAWAILAGARRFGATAHEMQPAVDTGAIIGVDLFDVEADATRRQLDAAAYGAAARLFWRFAGRFARPEPQFTPLALRWGAPKPTRRDYARMCEISPDMGPEELKRRIAAFGDGDGLSRPAVTLHGVRFELPAPPEEAE